MGYMHILLVGVLVLTASTLLSGTIWRFIHPVAFLAAFLLAGVCQLARMSPVSDRHAARTATIMEVLMVAVLLGGMRGWNIGVPLLVLSSVLNVAVQAANDWRMPTIGAHGPLHTEYDPDRTRLVFLRDRFYTTWRGGGAYFSLGDALCAVGVWVFTAELWLVRF